MTAAETAADVSVWIPTHFGSIVWPLHLSLSCVTLKQRFFPSPRGQDVPAASRAGRAASGMQGVGCFEKSSTGHFKANKRLKQSGSRQLEEEGLRLRLWNPSQDMLQARAGDVSQQQCKTRTLSHFSPPSSGVLRRAKCDLTLMFSRQAPYLSMFTYFDRTGTALLNIPWASSQQL